MLEKNEKWPSQFLKTKHEACFVFPTVENPDETLVQTKFEAGFQKY